MEQTHLLFKTEGLYFLLPLAVIQAVEAGRRADADWDEICDLAYFCGLRKQREETDYILAVTTGTDTLQISVDLVIGVHKIDESLIKQLDAPIIWEKNRYLDKAAVMKELDPPIAYILDISQLQEK